MITKQKLPNESGNPDANLVSEYLKYIELYLSNNRENVSEGVWGGSEAYSGKEYPYTGGTEGLMNLLYDSLENYIIDQAWVDSIQNAINSTQQVFMSNAEYSLSDNTVLNITGDAFPEDMPAVPYDVQFYAPSAVKEGDKLSVAGGAAIPIYTLSKSPIPSGAWVADSLVRLTVSPSRGYAILTGYSKSVPFAIKSGSPIGSSFTEEDKKNLWIDEATNVAYYWNASANTWKPIAGTFAAGSTSAT